MSSSTAAWEGSERSGSSASTRVAAGDTDISMALSVTVRGVLPTMTAEQSPGMTRERALKLAAIGTAAGLFSGLFGVGGGTVIVPLLVLWLGYGEREATGTSLAAIVFIAAFAAAVQGGYGNVHVRDGILIGIPAVGGCCSARGFSSAWTTA